MAKLLACLRPLTTDDETGSTTRADREHNASSAAATPQESRKVTCVELLRRTNEPLGLVVEGGADKNQPVHISQLRPGGVAEKSLALQTGDHILSINGTATEHLMHSEITALLDNSGHVVNLEISYKASPDSDVSDEGTLKKTAVISLSQERNSFGFTISGGCTENRPITVSHVVVGSIAFRRGVLKVGDRILKINNVDVTKASQLEAVSLLQASESTCTLEMEYDVTVHEGLSESRGPLLVELLKPKGASLGISLSGALHLGQPMYISKIKEAGIADRCGALHVGDQLVSVNSVTLENKTIHDAVRLLARSDLNVKLEIIPAHNFTIVPDLSQEEALSDTLSRLSDPHTTRQTGRQSQLSVGSANSPQLLCHPETMRVQLKADDIGFGLSLHGGVTGRRYRPIKIAVIEEGGPAALAGVLHVGDRILSINGVRVDGVTTAHQALKLVQEGGDLLDMEVECDVTDAVVPTSGTFDVKMVKTSSLNLGITINGSHKREDNIWISSLKKGGIASRMGTLKPGDVILAINGQSLESCNLREAAHMLRNAGDIVTLTISKESAEKPSTGLTPSEAVIFSVELIRNGQPLGISLTGSNHHPKPMYIARIKEGGVAHRTGALKVGDRVMAINGQSLFGKTLAEALTILQNAGDTVTLKISKLNRRTRHSRPKALSPTGKLYHRYNRDMGFSRRSRGNGSPQGRLPSFSSRLSRTGSFGSSPVSGLRMRRLSSTTLASTVSGADTPDIPPAVPSATNFEPLPPLHPRYTTGQDRLQLTPSDHSAFVRPGPVEGEPDSSRVPTPRRHNSVDGSYSPGGYQSPSLGLSHMEFFRARQRSLQKRRNVTEIDEDVLHKEFEVTTFQPRRSSFPVHTNHLLQMARPARWDFKARAMPYSKIPVGRVSPITPSDHERTSVVPRFSKQGQGDLASGRTTSGKSTPPSKPTSLATESRSQSPQKPELVSAEQGEEGVEREEEEEQDEEEEEEEDEEEEEEEEEVEGSNVTVDIDTKETRLAPGNHTSNRLSTDDAVETSPTSSPKPKHPPTKSIGTVSSPDTPSNPASIQASECLDGIERTLHKSRNFIQEFKALAESGSSDQDSDVEPLSSHLKAAKIMEQISTAAMLPTKYDHHVIQLRKDGHADFGFSLSDGLGEPGVYIKKLTPGGVAEQSGKLQPFDRIMKINGTMVRDYDCCKVVPILQQLQDEVTLVIVRNALAKHRKT